MTHAAAGTWAEISYDLIAAGARAADVPADTAKSPYVVRVRGWLAEAARLGEPATVHTATARLRTGILTDARPADDHTFGRPHPVLLAAIVGIQAHLAESR